MYSLDLLANTQDWIELATDETVRLSVFAKHGVTHIVGGTR